MWTVAGDRFSRHPESLSDAPIGVSTPVARWPGVLACTVGANTGAAVRDNSGRCCTVSGMHGTSTLALGTVGAAASVAYIALLVASMTLVCRGNRSAASVFRAVRLDRYAIVAQLLVIAVDLARPTWWPRLVIAVLNLALAFVSRWSHRSIARLRQQEELLAARQAAQEYGPPWIGPDSRRRS